MCGITAAFAYGCGAVLSEKERGELSAACLRMDCRGPDAAGLWYDDAGRIGFAHRRLAIIDLSDESAQPMRSELGTTVIAFNGEIYNYRELRESLEASGCRFRSQGDTEVLLQLYEKKGAAMVHDLRGMFAFAIWDQRRQGLLLARDPFGIKPLYYADTGQAIFVASEVKALRKFSGIDSAPDPAGHVGFFVWGHVPEPFTMFRGIRSLPTGSTLWIDDNGSEPIRQYAAVAELFASAESQAANAGNGDVREVQEELRVALLDSVRHHLIADVDVGVFLSSGLDSTTLAALAAEAGGRLRTVTLGFEEFRGTAFDETPLAELVARTYGADHQTVWISREEFRRELPRLIDRMDQPSIDGVNTYFVARAAREAGLKVALSGLGGDELLGGYSTFREVPRLVDTLKRLPAVTALGRGFRIVSSPILRRLTSPKYAGIFEYGGDYPGAYLLRRGLFLPWELGTVMDVEFAQAGWRELDLLNRLNGTVRSLSANRLKVSALEASWYMRNQLLRDTDWASMSHSLEVRVPLVDWTLWRTVSRLLNDVPGLGKQAMARTARLALPEPVINRPKTGFMTPVREWTLSDNGAHHARGLRGWAQFVYQAA